jgi:MFS family permease
MDDTDIDIATSFQQSVQVITRKQVAAVCVGNGLDFYDFMTFAFFAPQIGRTMFPDTGGNGLLYVLLTFGAGFATRPIGGILFGRYADRHGRKPAMLLSFSLMGVAMLALAITPSYAAIGLAAPVIVIACRLLQGLALGGEVGPNTAYLMEAAPPGRQGLYVSMQYVSQNLAVVSSGLIGAILATVLTATQLDQFGWRIAFLLGVSIVPFALIIRGTLEETLTHAQSHTAQAPHSFRFILFGGLLMLSAGTIGDYGLQYLGTYAQNELALPPISGFGVLVVLGLVGISCDLLCGTLIDRGVDVRLLLIPWILMIILVVPLFMLLDAYRTNATLFGVSAILALLLEMQFMMALVLFTRALPTQTRATALGGVYAVAIAVFGGSTQAIINRLLVWTANPLAPAWYIAAAFTVGLAGVALVMRGTRIQMEFRGT